MILFFCAKKNVSETETQSALNFSTLEAKTYFTSPECVPVNIWSWRISVWRLNFSFWLWHQTKNFAIYICCSVLSFIVSASKATDFFLLHFLSVYRDPNHSMLAEPHSGDSSSYCVFTSPRVELPSIPWEFGVAFQQRMHRRRDKKTFDKSSHPW